MWGETSESDSETGGLWTWQTHGSRGVERGRPPFVRAFVVFEAALLTGVAQVVWIRDCRGEKSALQALHGTLRIYSPLMLLLIVEICIWHPFRHLAVALLLHAWIHHPVVALL